MPGYPNFEIRQAFLAYLVQAFSDINPKKIFPLSLQLKKAFLENDLPKVINVLNTLFTGVPYHIFDEQKESYFHSLVHVIFSFFGAYIESEVNTNAGRIDSVIHAPDYIYILEFKMNVSAHAALDQIKNRNYAQKYRGLHKPIIGVGVNFSSSLKNIDGYQQEEL